jgi:hypothetical protein
MSCIPSGSSPQEQFKRAEIGKPIRQGFLTRKTLLNQGKRVRGKDRLSFVILSTIGIFMFDYDKIDTTVSARQYMKLDEEEFKVEDKTEYDTKTFQFLASSTLNQIMFICHDYNEKDSWLKAFNEARDQASGKNTNTSSSGVGVWDMKAIVTLTVTQAKELLPCEGSNGDHYCKMVMENDVHVTEVQNNTLEPKWNSTCQFRISRMPEDLIIAVYDSKNGNDVVGQVYLKIDSARSSNDVDEWYPLRPVRIGEKVSGKIHVKVQCRYDPETQRKVTFGVPLADLMGRKSHQDLVVPDIAFKCLSRLHTTSLKSQGLFRVSGNKNKIRDYETKFDQENVNVSLSENEDEHTVAGLFKLFLRELPEPIIPYELYDTVMDAGKEEQQGPKLTKLRKLVAALPSVNRDLIFYTCSLLHSQTKYADVNLMKPTNLAIVFGSVFSYAPPERNIPKQTFLTTHLPQLTATCENMIQEFYDVFEIPQDVDPLQQLKKANNKRTTLNQILLEQQSSSVNGEKPQQLQQDEHASNENFEMHSGNLSPADVLVH